MTLSLAQFGIVGRASILLFEDKRKSEKRAESCVSLVRLLVFNDETFDITSPRDFTVEDNTCTILEIEESATLRTAKVRGAYGATVTNMIVTIDSTDGTLTSLTEVPQF
jgi:hypothetical protein